MSQAGKPISAISPFWDVTISAAWVAFLGVLGVNILGNMIMPQEHAAIENYAYPIEPVAEEDTGGGGGGGGQRESALPLIAAANPEAGAAVFRKCTSCHTIDAGGKNGTGPNLHNIVGDVVGAEAGFKYSESMKALGGNWDFAKLEDYLENPKRLVPKGTMSFVGLKKAKERADVIRYLVANTDSPPPLPSAEAPAAPEAAPAAAPAEAAPAGAAPAQ
jgi:cytochrome c